MKISEIIHTLAEPISSVMERYGKGNIDVNFPSRAMAYTIYLYNKKTITDNDITDKNNPFGLVDPSTNNLSSFNSLEEAVLAFNDIELNNEEFFDKYKSIAKANNLYRFDKEAMEKEKGNIIDMEDVEPSVDQYTVKNNNQEVLKTSNLEEANKMAELNAGSKVYNSRGVAVNAKQTSTKSDKIIPVDLKAGAKIVCNNLNLYYKLKDKRPGRSITGEYYLYDGKKVNDRYAICTKLGSDENPVYTVLGFINAKDIDA